MGLKESFLFLSHGHLTFLSSNSYLHLIPERYAIIYSKNRLHPFPPGKGKGNSYFLRREKEPGISYLTTSPPKF